jgi:hypothetical protein
MSEDYHRAVLRVNHFGEILAKSNGGVKDLRLKNLRSLAEARQWKPSDFVREVGKSPSYWSDMLRGAKGFGEVAAREIEEALQLPRLWLDMEHDRTEAPPEPAGLAGAIDALARAIAKLPKLDRRQLAPLLSLLAEEPEMRAETCKSIMRWLAPNEAYEYKLTWEEAAREVVAALGNKKLTGADLLALIDEDHKLEVKPRLAKSG